MRISIKWPLAAVAALFVAGCGGGGGGGAAPAAPPPPPPPPPPPATVTISGKVTYDFVPVSVFGGLDYTAIDSDRPVRLATVQFVDSGNNVITTTKTDENGDYSFDVDSNTTGRVRVRAESGQTGNPGWFVRVLDNTASDAIYTLDGALLSSGSADSQRDLHAPSGWTGSNYGNPRAAAPFAILDTILIGGEFVISADPTLNLPQIDVHWSENNVSSFDPGGNVNPDTGEIGTSQFAFTQGMFLLGEEDTDTEEYDRNVILHEFGHYLEFHLARSDTIGGPHALGDEVDMRVAYSEGLATALSALMLDNPIFKDTGGPGQAGAFTFSVEGTFGTSSHGWYSEISAHELIYDLVDLDNTNDNNDVFSYPFSTVWNAMIGPVANSDAVTSLFPFLNAIKNANPGDAVALDLFIGAHNIGPVTSDFGENETNNANSADVLPIYTPLTVNDLTPVNVCSTDEFRSGVSGSTNKLSSRRFIRFTPPATGNITITAIATEIPAGEYADPDFIIHRRGPRTISGGQPSDACTNTADPFWVESNCVEIGTTNVVAVGEHILEIYEWTNTNAEDDDEFPPIGRTCFDVTVTQP